MTADEGVRVDEPNFRLKVTIFVGQLMRDYFINIFYSEEDGVYIADIPDFEFSCYRVQTSISPVKS